jgi:hypothetical protein
MVASSFTGKEDRIVIFSSPIKYGVIMNKNTRSSSVLNLRIGSAEADPQETRRHKRLMKGARRRITTHKSRIELYRTIIRERAVTHFDVDNNSITVPLAEPEVQEYRMKLLKEKALLMAAKRDFDAHRQMYEDRVGQNADGIRTILKDAREDSYAEKHASSKAIKVMDILKRGKGSAERFATLAQPGNRKEFRNEVDQVVRESDAELALVFDKHAKLFGRVIELVVQELRQTDNNGGAQ